MYSFGREGPIELYSWSHFSGTKKATWLPLFDQTQLEGNQPNLSARFGRRRTPVDPVRSVGKQRKLLLKSKHWLHNPGKSRGLPRPLTCWVKASGTCRK